MYLFDSTYYCTTYNYPVCHLFIYRFDSIYICVVSMLELILCILSLPEKLR